MGLQTELFRAFIRLFSVGTCLDRALVTEATVAGTQCMRTLPPERPRAETTWLCHGEGLPRQLAETPRASNGKLLAPAEGYNLTPLGLYLLPPTPT